MSDTPAPAESPPAPRPYDSETAYPVVLAAARAAGEMYITGIARALLAAGIEWPGLQSSWGQPPTRSAAQVAVDRDILRAWRELGYRPGVPPRPPTGAPDAA